MGELMEMVQRWAWLASLLVLGCWGAGAIRYWRKAAQLDLEAYKARPLLPDDKVAVMRPGDTVLLLLPLDGMTLDQQTNSAIKQMVVSRAGMAFLWAKAAPKLDRLLAGGRLATGEAHQKISSAS